MSEKLFLSLAVARVKLTCRPRSEIQLEISIILHESWNFSRAPLEWLLMIILMDFPIILDEEERENLQSHTGHENLRELWIQFNSHDPDKKQTKKSSSSTVFSHILKLPFSSHHTTLILVCFSGYREITREKKRDEKKTRQTQSVSHDFPIELSTR